MIIKIYSAGLAKFLTGPAFSLLEINAVVLIDRILEGHSLRIGDINSLPLYQTFIIDIINFFRTFFSTCPTGNTFIQIHKPWMLDNLHRKITFFSRNILYFTQRK
jgi:hypothetical protein